MTRRDVAAKICAATQGNDTRSGSASTYGRRVSRCLLSQIRTRSAGPPGTDRRAPPGFTLVEIVIALAVFGVTVGLGLRGLRHLTDASATRGAAAEVRAAFATARALAVRRGERAAVRIDSVGGAVTVHLRTDTVVRLPLATLYRVRLSPTRDSAAYGAAGLGYGGTNLRVTVRRGASAETVVVSRLGRVR